MTLQQLRRAVEPVKTSEGWQPPLGRFARGVLPVEQHVERAQGIAGRVGLAAPHESQVAALQRADSVFSERVRGVYGQLGEFLARGNGGAGKAELDSANDNSEGLLADLLGAARDRRLDRHGDAEGAVSDLRSMLNTTKKDRENSETHFGHHVTMAPARASAGQGGTAAPLRSRAGP